jgi:hypothetical protein
LSYAPEDGFMKHLILILIPVFLFSSAGFAVDNASDNLTLPHSFSSGETISSSKMNENFEAIQEHTNSIAQRVSGLESLKFPDGFSGIIVQTSADYTVPSGKNLYILTIGNNQWLNVNGEEIWSNQPSLQSPIIISENSQLNSTGTSNFTGLLINQKVTPLFSDINYTVPADKTLFILNIIGSGDIKINGANFLSNSYQRLSLSIPFIVKSGHTLTSTSSIKFLGYLK